MALQPPDLDELLDDFLGRLGPNAHTVDAVAQRHEVLVFYRHEQFHVDAAARVPLPLALAVHSLSKSLSIGCFCFNYELPSLAATRVFELRVAVARSDARFQMTICRRSQRRAFSNDELPSLAATRVFK